jgi:uncharacterized membrane protein YhaH (DUF805 family)
MEHFTAAFKNFANFKDRATRQQYWMFFLIYMVIVFLLMFLEAFIGFPILSGIFTLVMFVPSLSYGARRLHDIGMSGWWQLLIIIPVIGVIAVLIMFALPGKEEAQERFGIQPA